MQARDAAALASLEHDHRLLWGLTEALHTYIGALDAGTPLRRGDFKALVMGLKISADYHHFEKEEEVMVPVLVRHGFAYDLQILDDGRREHASLRYLIEVLRQSAERELNWRIDERERISRVARQLIARQRRLSKRQEARLFPQIVARLDPPVLGQLTEQLCHFDEVSATRVPELDVSDVAQQVVTHYAATLPPIRELAG